MSSFSRGQRGPIDGVERETELTAELTVDAPHEWDVVCVGADDDDRLTDEAFLVFYNQPSAPAGAIEKVAGDGGGGRSETFRLRLDRLPDDVRRLSFCAAVGSGGSAGAITSGTFRLSAGGRELMTYAFSGQDFTVERSIVVAEVYFKSRWRMAAVGQGYPGGLVELLTSFGADIDDEPDPPPTPAPSPTPAPAPAYVKPTPTPAPANTPSTPEPTPAPPASAPAYVKPTPEPLDQDDPIGPPSRAERVAPGALVSLRKYLATPATGRWTAHGPYAVRVGIGAPVHARRGSMIAYRGKIDFSYKGSGGLSQFFAGRMTGQQLRLMTCSGQGEVYLAENAVNLHIVELNGRTLCINASNVLAFDTSLRTDVRRIESAGLPGGGMFHLEIGGNGTVVVMTRGTPVALPATGPTFVDTRAVVAWTAGMRLTVTSQVRMVRSWHQGRSGEDSQLQFMGTPGHFVVVQPYEV